MRSLTGVVIVVAGVLVLALAVFMRFAPPGTEAPAQLQKDSRALSRTPLSRSARVEERLTQLRGEYERRKMGAPAVENRIENLPPKPTLAPRLAPADLPPDMDAEDVKEFEELRNTLLTNPDPDERIGAALMLSGGDDEPAKKALIEAMGDPDAEVRLAVVEALGDYSDDLTPGVLSPAVNDPDPEVRFEAVGILGDMDGPQALAMVRNALNDPDEDVRSLAEGIVEFAED
jgi:HEAT repeats